MKYKSFKVKYWWLGLLFGFVGCFFLSFTLLFDFRSFLIALPFCVCFLVMGKYGGQLMLEDELYIRVKTK